MWTWTWIKETVGEHSFLLSVAGVLVVVAVAFLVDKSRLDIKKKTEKYPFLSGVVGVIFLPALVAAVAAWSIWFIEGLFNFFVDGVGEWLSDGNSKGGLGYRVNVLIGLGSVLGVAALGWRNYALQRQAKAAFEQAKAANKQADTEAKRADTAARQAKAATKQADREHKARISNQFTQAMKGLAREDSRGKPLREERIGGLYSLESLAHDDLEGYGVRVMKTIVAYIRENAQKTAGDMPKKTGNADMDEQRARPLSEDVKEAFAILKRLYDQHVSTQEQREKIKLVRFFDDGGYERRSPWIGVRKPVRDDLDFSRADFHELDFRGVEWIDRPCCDRTNFQKANLRNTDLAGAHLEEALLHGTHAFNIDMCGAHLWHAQLQGANLSRARLQGSNLWGADLQDAELLSARLQGANLSATHLQGAYLRRAKLQGANLVRAQLQRTNLDNAELNLSVWHGVRFDINKKSDFTLEELDRKRNKGLWKSPWQPEPARIFCDKDFALLKYDNPKVEPLDPNDDSIDWRKEWKMVLRDIDSLSRHHVVRRLISVHGREFITKTKSTFCALGLRIAIQDLPDYAAIKEKLPRRYQLWVGVGDGNLPLSWDTKS